MKKFNFKKWSLFAGLWFGLLGYMCGFLYDFFLGLDVIDNSFNVYYRLFTFFEFFWGGYLGYNLVFKTSNVSLIKVLIIGIVTPILAVMTMMISTMLVLPFGFLADGKFIDALAGLFTAILLGLTTSLSITLISFWLTWPVNIIGAFLLYLYFKYKKINGVVSH